MKPQAFLVASALLVLACAPVAPTAGPTQTAAPPPTTQPTPSLTPTLVPAVKPTPVPSPESGGTFVVVEGLVYINCRICGYFATIEGPGAHWQDQFGGTSDASTGRLVIDYEESHPPLQPGNYEISIEGWSMDGDGSAQDDRGRPVTSCSAPFEVAAGSEHLRLIVDFLPVSCRIGVLIPIEAQEG